jgi:hypothetical protein
MKLPHPLSLRNRSLFIIYYLLITPWFLKLENQSNAINLRNELFNLKKKKNYNDRFSSFRKHMPQRFSFSHLHIRFYIYFNSCTIRFVIN